MHKQNVSRKAFIEPGLTKETKAILKETQVGEYLYGSELTEKLKDAKAVVKMAETLKLTQAKTAAGGKTHFNQKPPFAETQGEMGDLYLYHRVSETKSLLQKQTTVCKSKSLSSTSVTAAESPESE